jgi:hypothetical protein
MIADQIGVEAGDEVWFLADDRPGIPADQAPVKYTPSQV